MDYISVNNHKQKVSSTTTLTQRKFRKKKLINLDFIESFASDNAEYLKQIFTAFMNSSDLHTRSMRDHFVHRDYISLRKAAHAIGTYIGVNELTVVMSNLEQSAKTQSINEIPILLNRIEALVEKIVLEINDYFETGGYTSSEKYSNA